MKTRDKNPDVRVDDEPEDERPLGTSEDEAPPPNGLAADPYADDVMFRLNRARVPRWLIIGLVVLIVVAVVLVFVALRLRGA